MDSDLQALVTGALAGALMGSTALLVDVDIQTDDDGNYQPWFFVTGRESGARVLVHVMADDSPGEGE